MTVGELIKILQTKKKDTDIEFGLKLNLSRSVCFDGVVKKVPYEFDDWLEIKSIGTATRMRRVNDRCIQEPVTVVELKY